MYVSSAVRPSGRDMEVYSVRGMNIMWSDFLRKPSGVGASVNVYMFRPQRLWHAVKLLILEPSYFFARTAVLIYQMRHPDAPWLTSAAVSYLNDYLTQDMRGFEWGSGRSTKWFAKRVGKLVSVEDDQSWFNRVRSDRLLNVDYRYAPTNEGCKSYFGQITEFPDGFFDFVLVDGSCRDLCIRAVASKVRSGGLIVVDNADSNIDVSPLASLVRIPTDNGVWRTDIYVNEPKR